MQFKKELVLVNIVGIMILITIFRGMTLYTQNQMGKNIIKELKKPTIEQEGKLTGKTAYEIAKSFEGPFDEIKGLERIVSTIIIQTNNKYIKSYPTYKVALLEEFKSIAELIHDTELKLTQTKEQVPRTQEDLNRALKVPENLATSAEEVNSTVKEQKTAIRKLNRAEKGLINAVRNPKSRVFKLRSTFYYPFWRD